MEPGEDVAVNEHKRYTPYVCGGLCAGEARVWLLVTATDHLGTTITGNTVDDHQVQIKLNSPLQEPITGWIEAIGKLQGRTLLCSEFVVFPEEITKSIDIEGHKSLAKLLTTLDDPWDLGQDAFSNGDANGY